MNKIVMLNEASLSVAAEKLCQSDDNLKSVVDQFGLPPLWARAPGFPTLIQIILEQQVSLASAKACFDKLDFVLHKLNPESFLTLDDTALLRIGFSRQKTRYSRILAQAIKDGALDIDALIHDSDDEVFSKLTALTGIGPWTANIYLLMALGRPDIWPGGDLALEVALQNLLGLDHRPRGEEFQQLAEAWRPHRAVAARILWHYYLSR
ncbi:MAG: DNA-3-methyladenine glycosylase 2 family protein [FCB group bacterium]|nr:DNA-3-methyladenine glycosylase 2 family protein [FCB group bacterium]MBL7028575.1 DNA-3-methyladenine glycosylase 2 family protein [Candidatus Neomarinimicrobiota bacterium]MBL7120794.1 DNA-3-methyladenine glycosylase 2 family protein [Candidatus Neomarinimicrobiota bacterium]